MTSECGKHTFRRSLPEKVRETLKTGQGRAAVDALHKRTLAAQFYGGVPRRDLSSPSRQVRRAKDRQRIKAGQGINREAVQAWTVKAYRKGEISLAKLIGKPKVRRHAKAAL